MHKLLVHATAKLQLPPAQVDALWQFCLHYQHWHKSRRLTSAASLAEFISDHLIDSLSALSCLSGERILDVGTGCGLPGLPLAIADPDRNFTLVDRSARKLAFVRFAASRLKIPNLTVLQQDVEAMLGTFDTVIVRALAPPSQTLPIVAPRVAESGRLILMQPASRQPPTNWVAPKIKKTPARPPAHATHNPTTHCLWLYDTPCVPIDAAGAAEEVNAVVAAI